MRISHRLSAIAVLLASAFIGGCQQLNNMLEQQPKPTASIAGVHIQDLSLESATLAFDVNVGNPYSVALPLTNVEYSLATQGAPFLTGKADVQGNVPAKGSKVVTIPATISFARVLEVAKGIKPGATVPYDAALTLSVDAPVVGRVALPLKKQGEFPIPTVPSVELTDVKWDQLSFDRAAATLRVKVGNRNQFPVDLSKLSLALSLGGHSIASTAVDQAVKFQAGQDKALEIPISFSPSQLGLAAFSVLRGSGSTYKINGNLNLGTSFGPLSMPYEKTGDARFR